MNRDTEIRFQGQVFNCPKHILDDMIALTKSYPSVADPVIAERDTFKAMVEKLQKVEPKLFKKLFKK